MTYRESDCGVSAVLYEPRALVAESLGDGLQRQGINIIGAVTDIELAAKKAAASPGAVLLLAGIDQAASELTAIGRGGTACDIPVILLMEDHDPRRSRLAQTDAINAIVSTRAPLAELVDALGKVGNGERLFCNPARLDPGPRGVVRFGLTDRELEVLEALADGLSTVELADRLELRPSTARTYIQRVLFKLGVHSRSAAVSFASRHQLVGV